jgi:hypothetical protein
MNDAAIITRIESARLRSRPKARPKLQYIRLQHPADERQGERLACEAPVGEQGQTLQGLREKSANKTADPRRESADKAPVHPPVLKLDAREDGGDYDTREHQGTQSPGEADQDAGHAEDSDRPEKQERERSAIEQGFRDEDGTRNASRGQAIAARDNLYAQEIANTQGDEGVGHERDEVGLEQRHNGHPSHPLECELGAERADEVGYDKQGEGEQDPQVLCFLEDPPDIVEIDREEECDDDRQAGQHLDGDDLPTAVHAKILPARGSMSARLRAFDLLQWGER